MSDFPAQPRTAELPVATGWPKHRLLLRLLSLLLLGIVLFVAGRDLRRDFRGHPWREVHIQPLFVALSLLSLLIARLLNAMNCQQLLAALGAPLPARRLFPVVWVAALGRYIPGKVAVVAGAALMIVRLGVTLPTVLAALFLSTALMILMGMITSAPLLFLPALRHVLPSAPLFSTMIVGLGLLFLYPPVFLKLCNRILRRLKRPTLPERLQHNAFWTAVGIVTLRSAFLGLGLWCAARALAPIGFATYPFAVAAGGLASFIGFFFVFAPAGLGIHEEIYLKTMRLIVGAPVAWLVALFRILHVIADLAAGAAGLLLIRINASRKSYLPAAPAGAPSVTLAPGAPAPLGFGEK